MLIFKKPLAVFSVATIIVFLATIIIAGFNLNKVSDELIIRFNNTDGVKTFGTKIDVLGILAISAVMLVLNFFLSENLFYRDRALTLILLVSNIFISVLSLIVISLVVSIN